MSPRPLRPPLAGTPTWSPRRSRRRGRPRNGRTRPGRPGSISTTRSCAGSTSGSTSVSGSAAAEFASALNDRFVGSSRWLEWFDDDDDLDSLADERDERIDDYDRFLADQTAADLESGLVDGTPDRIPPPPGSSDASKVSESTWESTIGLEIPYRSFKFSIGGKQAGTVHELADGTFVVEIEDSALFGIRLGSGDASVGVEGSAGIGARYHLPDRATLDEFRARLDNLNGDRNAAALTTSTPYSFNPGGSVFTEQFTHSSRQFDALYDRYQIGDTTKYGAGPTFEYDGAVGDVSGTYQVQRSIDWTTGEVSDIRHIEGELRGTSQVFTGGAEVEADFRRVTRGDDLVRVEFEITGYGEGGLTGELDALRREGLGDVLDDNRYLRNVGFRSEATAGVWGRYNVVIPADTPENEAFARRMADLVERGQVADVINAARASGSGSVRFEYGGFVGRETDASAVVTYESQDRYRTVWYQSPELPFRR